jgi:uncharacterized protein
MWITALLMGLAGSLHCVGMCSPLSVAISGITKRAWINRLVYNGGRIFTYGIAGAIVSSLGILIPPGNAQDIISLTLGVLLIIAGVAGIKGIQIPALTVVMGRVVAFLRTQFSVYIKRKNFWSTWMLGMLNGLLPCGLTFIALTFCLTLQGPVSGFNFMILFGAGTLPAMIGLPSLLTFAANKFHFSLSRALTLLLLVSGSVLIVKTFMPTHHTPNAATPEVVCR